MAAFVGDQGHRLGMFSAVGRVLPLNRNAALEREVDGVLAQLPDSYLVLCGRPWEGESSADRVVIGPSGAWLVVVEGSVPPTELPVRLGVRARGGDRG